MLTTIIFADSWWFPHDTGAIFGLSFVDQRTSFPLRAFCSLARSWVLHTRVLPILTPPRLWRHISFFFAELNQFRRLFVPYLFSTASVDRHLRCRHWHHMDMPHFFMRFFVFVLKLLFPLVCIPEPVSLNTILLVAEKPMGSGVAGNQRRRSCAWELSLFFNPKSIQQNQLSGEIGGKIVKLLTYCALQTLVELAEKRPKKASESPKLVFFLSLMVVLHIR